jgi:hypothetical protein
METRLGTTTTQPPPPSNGAAAKSGRRKALADVGHNRYFLPKPGSTPDKPELGRELQSEGEALIEAFRSGQPFFMLKVCKAATEVNGAGSPVIVKQVVAG